MSIWWPGISQIYDFVHQCSECYKDALPQREPLMPTLLPGFPRQKAATDLFELNGITYLVVVDYVYFSCFPEVIWVKSTTSISVINALNGIREMVVSDNNPQFSSIKFTNFTATYGFNK